MDFAGFRLRLAEDQKLLEEEGRRNFAASEQLTRNTPEQPSQKLHCLTYFFTIGSSWIVGDSSLTGIKEG
jgi:hypothetical protein